MANRAQRQQRNGGLRGGTWVAGAAMAVAVGAALYLAIPGTRTARAPVDQRTGSSPADAPATPSPGDSGGGAEAAPATSIISAGEGGSAPQVIDYGDMDARPWVYRNEAERQAARQAAATLRGRQAGPAGGPAEPATSATNFAPIIGDGPLGPSEQPRKSGLPGPGETVTGTGRSGPAAPPPEIAGPRPEDGPAGRATSGPAKPGPVSETLPEPARPSVDPDAPGPGN